MKRLAPSSWTTLGLVVTALGLGFVLAVTQTSQSSSEKLARENNVLGFFRGDDLIELEVIEPRSKLGGVRLRKDPTSSSRDAYFLGASDAVLADANSVAELLGALEFATWSRRLDTNDADLDALGLRAPLLEVRLNFRGQVSRLLIGKIATAPANSYYARVQDPAGNTQTGVVAKKLVDRLLLDQRGFRGRLLLPYAKSELAELGLGKGADTVRLIADASGFRLGAGGLRADRERTDRVLFQLARVSASEFLDESSAQRSLEQAAASVIVVRQVPKSGPAVEVHLGGSCPDHPDLIIALRTTPDTLAGCVTRTVLPALSVTGPDLVDRTLSPLESDEIDHVVVASVGGRFDLMRRDSAFELRDRSQDPITLSLELGNEFLKATSNRQGNLVAEPAPDRAADGTISLVGAGAFALGSNAPEVRSELHLWKTAAGWLVRRADDGARLLFPAQDAWFLDGDTAWAKSRELLLGGEGSLSRISVRLGNQSWVMAQEGGSWVLREPSGYALDARLSGDWLRALGHLEVQRFLPKDSVLPSTVTLEVDVESGGGRPPAHITVGPRVRGGYVARSSSDPFPFVLAPEAVRLLSTLPIDRSALVVDPGQLEAFELETSDAHYRFARRGDAWIETSGQGDPDLPMTVLESLNELQPLAAAHTGQARPEEGLSRPALRFRGRSRAADGTLTPFSLEFGAVTVFQGQVAQWARVAGVDASFCVGRVALQELLDLL